jgi:HTH-type transcriptional regulator, glycine betaine synthesis regulator
MLIDPSSPPIVRADSVLTRFELETIDFFVRIARLFGIPKSVGEVYGLLFVSAAPLALEQIWEKLGMSSGSASQGLRLLRGVGAVHVTYVAGDRRDHYLVETNLKKILSGIIREKFAPQLLGHGERVDRISRLLELTPAPGRDCLEERVRILESWRQQTRTLLPLVMEGLEPQAAEGRLQA